MARPSKSSRSKHDDSKAASQSVGDSLDAHEEQNQKEVNNINNARDSNDKLYEVEDIVGHKYVKSKLVFHVKWQGYSEKENTWEPEKNLANVHEMVEAYQHQAGLSQPSLTVRKRGRPPKKAKIETAQSVLLSTSITDTPDVISQQLNDRMNHEFVNHNQESMKDDIEGESLSDDEDYQDTWRPHSKNWDNHVKMVHTLQKDRNGMLVAYVEFNNGRTAQVRNTLLHQRAPLALIDFYERHLNWKES